LLKPFYKYQYSSKLVNNVKQEKEAIMRLVLMFITVIFLSACASNKSTQPINVMIMVEDGSSDALPRNHQAVNRLVNNVSSQLSDQGMNVFDETAVTLDDFSYSSRLTSAELIDIARSIRHVKFDYIVLLSVNTNVQSRAQGKKISTKVYGKTIRLNSGKVAGSFNASGSRLNANNNCSRRCLNSKISDSVRSAAGEVAEEILSDLPTVITHNSSRNNRNSRSNQDLGFIQDYVLIFDGFNQSEMNEVDDYLTIFSGYDAMRYSESSHRYAEIWYESSIKESKLNRNVKRMLKEMDIRALVKQESNIVTIKKITLRGQDNKEKFQLDGWE
jgi:hypothetical protein